MASNRQLSIRNPYNLAVRKLSTGTATTTTSCRSRKTPESEEFGAETSVTRKRTRSDQYYIDDDVPGVLANRLDGAQVHYLTQNRQSWYILKRAWMPSTKELRLREWKMHPSHRHTIRVFGKEVEEKRWSQSWGISLKYSGSTSHARPLSESPLVSELIQKTNECTKNLLAQNNAYNACLQNWYEEEDCIGLHADDERELRRGFPIFSLSWGGTRRFLFRSKADSKDKVEIYLRDGDLLIMGGTCQDTHKHEVPKIRKTKDPPAGRRLNYTIRAVEKL